MTISIPVSPRTLCFPILGERDGQQKNVGEDGDEVVDSKMAVLGETHSGH